MKPNEYGGIALGLADYAKCCFALAAGPVVASSEAELSLRMREITSRRNADRLVSSPKLDCVCVKSKPSFWRSPERFGATVEIFTPRPRSTFALEGRSVRPPAALGAVLGRTPLNNCAVGVYGRSASG